MLLAIRCISKDIDYRIITNYEYVNGTTWNLSVTINKVNPDIENIPQWDAPIIFNLSPRESYNLLIDGGLGGFKEPLDFYPIAYSIVVSNGENSVIHYGADYGEIFQLDSYELIEESDYSRTYKYIITPAFFDDAETIE